MPSQKRVLLISKPEYLDDSLVRDLSSDGVTVAVASSVSEARQNMLENGLPSGMILDIRGMEAEAMDFCRDMTTYAGLGVILIGTEEKSQETISAAYDCADTYLRATEVHSEELALRIQRIFARMSPADLASGREIRLPRGTRVDLIDRTVTYKGKQVTLTPTETGLLHVLLTHSGGIVDSQTLIDRVWRGDSAGNPNALRVHMHRLRTKLGDQDAADDIIETVRGTGYLLNPR